MKMQYRMAYLSTGYRLHGDEMHKEYGTLPLVHADGILFLYTNIRCSH